MMTRKPDLFEQMVSNALIKEHGDEHGMLNNMQCVGLLRRYHARVQRLVRNEQAYAYTTFVIHDAVGRAALLRKLDQLKKGRK